ncbi:MAG: hypothetical protein AAGH15_15690 [Myxococcota bacterium]
MRYAGPERRIHHVFVTRNTEYHVRRDRCVAVRDRRSGQWVRGHLAVRSRVTGGLAFEADGAVRTTVEPPRVGESIYISGGGRDLVTSPVVSIERPAKPVVRTYDA